MRTVYIDESVSDYPYSLEISRYADKDIILSIVDNNKNEIHESAYLILNRDKQRELLQTLRELLGEKE